LIIGACRVLIEVFFDDDGGSGAGFLFECCSLVFCSMDLIPSSLKFKIE